MPRDGNISDKVGGKTHKVSFKVHWDFPKKVMEEIAPRYA